MEQINLNLPALDEIKSKLEVIDSKIDSIQKTNPSFGIWLTTKQAAKALDVTNRTLQNYRDQGLIPFSQFGRQIRYRAEDIKDFLMSHYIKANNQKGGRL